MSKGLWYVNCHNSTQISFAEKHMFLPQWQNVLGWLCLVIDKSICDSGKLKLIDQTNISNEG